MDQRETSSWRWIVRTVKSEVQWIAQRTAIIALSLGALKVLTYVTQSIGIDLKTILSGDWHAALLDMEKNDESRRD